MIPNSVLKDMDSICICFLWRGNCSRGPGLVNWQDCCVAKKDGGLGFRDSHRWNKALQAKLLWDIASKKDNLWVKWIHSLYIRDRNFWLLSPPNDVSWHWRAILKLRVDFSEIFWMQYSDTFVYTAKHGYDYLVDQPTPWK